MKARVRKAVAGLPLLVAGVAAAQPDWGTSPPGWPGFGYNSGHTAEPRYAAQSLTHIRWSTSVNTTGSGGAHYGTPMVTSTNAVIFPVRISGGFRVDARRGSDGALLWSQSTGFVPAASSELPPCGCTLTPSGLVAIPDSGGRVLVRGYDGTGVRINRELVFYGAANYAANPGVYNSSIRISTPITSDSAGNLYFGFVALGSTPVNLQNGIARVSSNGQGMWVSAAAASHDPTVTHVALNCAPALGYSGRVLYIALVTSANHGYMTALDSTTLASMWQARLTDPLGDATVDPGSTSCPTIGPDGDVYFGIYGDNHSNFGRGWMLHYDAKLTQIRLAGAFGWDVTPSIVPRECVPSYTGTSSYLLLTKYNNYVGFGGDGRNKVAILDPHNGEVEAVSGVFAMKIIISVLGPTPDPGAGANAVREWCINSTAIDPITHAALLNNEDGKLYRWDLNTNTLSQAVTLATGVGEPYTPTVIAPDGTVYAINNSVLCAVGN